MQRVYSTISVSILVKLEDGTAVKVDIEMLRRMVPFLPVFSAEFDLN
jgi:hypothetical protein